MAGASGDMKRQIDAWAEQLISRLSKAEQRKLARQIGTALRRENARRIRKNVAPDGSAWPVRKQQKSRRAKRGKMYKGLAKAKSLKVKVGPQGVMVGFYGRVARIARVAQYGLYDNVRPGGPRVKYDQRELLGFTDADYDMIRDLLAEQLSDG